MKIRRQKLEEADNLFKLVKRELKKDIGTHIIIHESIMLELRRNKKKKRKICLEVGEGKVEKWYTLYKGKSSEAKYKIGIRKFSKQYYQVIKFRGGDFGFSYLEEYVYDEYNTKRILVVDKKKNK